MSKLTKRAVDAAEVRASEYFIWDGDLPGFGVRVLPSGRKRYIVQYRAGRRSRRISPGPSTVLTCEQARSQAIAILAAARNGDDPAGKREAGRKAITVRELAERFDKEHIALRLKPSTAKGYRRMLARVILPALGNHRVSEVTRADIAKLHHDLRHIPYDANRCLEMISKMFNLAEMWGLRPDGSNPRKHILTGCRLGEIMTLRWEHVDIPGKELRLADSRTGAKVMHLGQPAIEVLENIRRLEDNPWVIVGALPGARLSDLQPFWQRVRARAGLRDVRIHDLRHNSGNRIIPATDVQQLYFLGDHAIIGACLAE